jgi:hypothetical protein
MEDPSLGPFDPGQVQIHDINPGDLNEPGQPQWFGAGGVFWTGRISPSSVSASPGRGDAVLHLDEYHLDDYIDVVNAVVRQPDGTPNIPAVPAMADVHVEWSGTGDTTRLDEPATDNSGPFAGKYQRSTMAVRWSADTDTDYHVRADSTTDADVNVTSAFTCKVRTGVFV